RSSQGFTEGTFTVNIDTSKLKQSTDCCLTIHLQDPAEVIWVGQTPPGKPYMAIGYSSERADDRKHSLDEPTHQFFFCTAADQSRTSIQIGPVEQIDEYADFTAVFQSWEYGQQYV